MLTKRSTKFPKTLPLEKVGGVTETLAERGTTYGPFIGNANIAQRLKAVMRDGNDKNLERIHIEALEMIFHKIARILNGNANFADSWHDIAGYAVLVENFIKGESA